MSASRNPRRLSLPLAVVALLIIGTAGIAAADSNGSSPSMPASDSEAEAFAAEMSVDLETARSMLDAQQVLADFAQSARANSWYSGFEVVNEPPNVRGVLAVTDPEGVVIPDGLSVTVVIGRVGESQMVEFGSHHTELLRDVLPTVFAVTYDPTSDTVRIWAREASLSAEDRAAIVHLLEAESPEVFGSADIEFHIGDTGWFTSPPPGWVFPELFPW